MIIDRFIGQYSFLSNFAYCDNLEIFGDNYKTAEHAFQAMKSINPDERNYIRNCDTSGQAKRAGKKITLREDWDEIKVGIMNYIVLAKFTQNNYFKELLLLTGSDILIEGNKWHDNFWGNCSCPKCKNIDGLNHLGKILMIVRSEI